MKKTILLFAFIATSVCAMAQVDTLRIGDREPTYYYWDTNWWDHYFINYPGANQIYWYSVGALSHAYCKAEVARYCYSDQPLRVIGIAVAASIFFDYNSVTTPATESEMLAKMVPEYLRLYEVDSATDNMILLDQAEWTHTLAPRYKIATSYEHATSYTKYEDLYEVFFDSVITVHDSFYVAMTGNNNYYRPNVDRASVCMAATRASDLYGYDVSEWAPKPNHYRRKLHLVDVNNIDFTFEETDTNWHSYSVLYHHEASSNKAPDLTDFMYIFPIIDTSRIIPPPTCRTPNGLTLVYVNDGTATLAWSGGNADHWELSLCADGCEPEEGSITQWNSSAATLQGLDTAQWYEARVRAVCSHDDSIYYSDWSDSLRFYMPGSNGGGGTDPTGIETTADRYTYVMPNPASGNVTVASSFRIGDVELLDLNGKSHLRTTVDGLSAALDISSLPAGTYIVRVTTSAGTAYKKLIVK